MCIAFDMEPNYTDINETLNYLFKRVKQRMVNMIDLVNLQNSTKIKETLESKDLCLGKPEEEVANDVIQRLLFLFEVKPAINYHAEVSKLSKKQIHKSIFSQGRMMSINEEAEEDALS